MQIIKHSILDLLREKEVLTLSEIASKLHTTEGHVLVTIKQMIDSGTSVKLRNDIVYKPKMDWKGIALSLSILAFLIGMIVFFPAVMGLN